MKRGYSTADLRPVQPRRRILEVQLTPTGWIITEADPLEAARFRRMSVSELRTLAGAPMPDEAA